MFTTRKLLNCALTAAAIACLGGCEEASLMDDSSDVVEQTSALTGPQGLAIVTTNALKDGSTMMGAYAAFKRQTTPTIIVTENKTYLSNGVIQNIGWASSITLPLPTNLQTTNVRAEAIHDWLKANYQALGLKDLLLIGNPCPLMGDLPMKAFFHLKNAEWEYPDRAGYIDEYCLQPRNPLPTTNAGCTQWKDKHDMARALPTDYYYSNLTYVWPKDSDGDIVDIRNTDFAHTDLNVGRIPVIGGNIAALDKTLAKFIAYTASRDTAWRKNALLSMNTHGGIGGSYVTYGEEVRSEILLPNAFSTYRIHWSFTAADCNTLNSTDRPVCLSEVNTGDMNDVSPVNMGSVWAGSAWSGCSGAICSQPKKNFGLVHWTGHGGPQGAADIIDLTNAAQNYTGSLDDSHPAFVVSQSCLTSEPTTADNISAVLLRNGAIGVLGATRISWPDLGSNWFPNSFINHAGNTDVTYGFIYELIDSGMPAGEAMSEVRMQLAALVAACTDGYTKRDWAAQLLLFNYNGDPTIGIENATNPSVINLPSDTPTNVTLTAGQTKTFFADNWPSKGNPYWTANIVLSVNSLTGKPIPTGTVWVNGVSYSIGGGNTYYQELDIPDMGPYTIDISASSATTLQIKLGNK